MVTNEIEELYRQRQLEIAPPAAMRRLPVHVIGAGGIGSNFCFLGAKLGLDLTVYDGDSVEAENVASQLFGPAHIGMPKVQAVREVCLAHAAMEINAQAVFVKGGEKVTGILVEALDSMEERKKIWEKVVLPQAAALEALVSVRMGAESGTVFTLRPGQARERIWYEANGLYSDQDSLPLPCTGRATSYCANTAASLAVHQVKRLLMRQQPILRRIDFDLANFMFIVEE